MTVHPSLIRSLWACALALAVMGCVREVKMIPNPADDPGNPRAAAAPVMPASRTLMVADAAVPPAMPHLIVAPDGTIGELHTGASSADELLALFTAAQDAVP